jgi:hypothetical protein
VSLLWSNEYPIASTLFDEHTDEDADNLNVVETSELLAGLLTVMPARAGSESVRTAEHVMIEFLKSFIGFLCDLKAQISPTPH